MESRVVITGGGSGGHVFPALAVAEILRAKGVQCIWLGSTTGIERRIVRRWGIPFMSFPAGKLRRYLSLRNLFDVFNTLAGIARCFFLLKKIAPSLVFSKGGFVSVPVVLAAGFLRIPVFSHESDLDPGLATRINARFARTTFVAYPESLKFYAKGRAKLTGNPIRKEMMNGKPDLGLEFLGFSKVDPRPIVLVVGGSLGARSINRVIDQILDSILPYVRVVHQRGKPLADEPLQPEARLGEYVPFDFLSDPFADVLACADFVISRSGAGSLWEIGLLQKPAIFIPLVAGARGDQLENARLCVEKGAALLWQSELDSVPELEAKIRRVASDTALRVSMAKAWKGLVHDRAADDIATLLLAACTEHR